MFLTPLISLCLFSFFVLYLSLFFFFSPSQYAVRAYAWVHMYVRNRQAT